MQIERTKNASRNIAFGITNRIVTLIAPFIIRTIIIYVLGVEYVGLSSLFASILSILNMAELGISTAIVYSMYSAIANEDTARICALMNLYRKAYRIIGCFVLFAGICVSPFLKFFISGGTPQDVNIYVVYFVTLSQTCLTYFLFAYKACLFSAFQRNDVTSNVASLVSIAIHAIQAVLLLLFKTYYAYVIVLPLSTIVNNMIISVIADKKYPNYKPRGSLDKSITTELSNKVKSLFLYRIGGVVLNSVDTIVISAFLGLTILGEYNNYYLIITVLFGFLGVINNSLTAGIGNSLNVDSKEKNYSDFKRLFIINTWLVSWCTTCLTCLYQPFMRIWVGKELMLPFAVAILLSLYFFVWRMMDVINLYKDAAGLWEYDKYRPLIAAIINLTINLLLIKTIGLYGVIVSTIFAIVVVIFPWSTFIIFKHLFNENTLKDWTHYIKKVLYSLACCAIVTTLTYCITVAIALDSLAGFVIKALVCLIVPNLLYAILFSLFKDFKETKEWVFSKARLIIKG